MTAKDLSVVDPAPFDSQLEGYAYIPRMLDKARATIAGTQGRYLFGCPVDHTCMARLNIFPELVLELAERYDDDHDVLVALKEHGIPTAEEAWFDAQGVEDELQGPGFYLRVRDFDRLPGGVFAGGEQGAPSVSVRLVEAQPGEAEERHTHPTEEVAVVVDGAGTWYLGEQQARIVRAGQVVRIRAGIVHRVVARPEGMRVVSAFGAPEIVTRPA